MTAHWRTIQVFLSSTFRDMHAERDTLVRVVFPSLRERLLPYRVELIDIDLRWGITREQAESEQVIALCLEQVEGCPVFVGILGGRYGWVPEYHPEDARQRFPWIDHNRNRSVTELEMLYGALDEAANERPALFFLRSDEALTTIPQQARLEIFEEQDEEYRRSLKQLKKRIKDSNYISMNYDAQWDATAWDRPSNQQGRLSNLDAFAQKVEEQLWLALKQYLQLPDAPNTDAIDPLDEEADLHERFLESRQRHFIGREQLLRNLHEFAEREPEQPLILLGPSGMGKSAALSRFVTQYRQRHSEVIVLPHFVGAGPRSASLHEMLGRLCGELCRQLELERDIPMNTQERGQLFLTLLAIVPEGRKVLLVIDAINQLETSDSAHELWWLPAFVPESVTVIASCLNDNHDSTIMQALHRREDEQCLIEPLTNKDRRDILRAIPKVSAKTLDESQITRLLNNPATKNPLYMLAALEELRGFGSFERLNEQIDTFPQDGDTLVLLFSQIFERLEVEFDRQLVQDVLTLLACSRRGLFEHELVALIKKLPRAIDLPIILLQLRAYLHNSEGRIGFYHTKVKVAVEQRYLEGDDHLKSATHTRLASYFAEQSLDDRQIEELPWQYAQGKDWARLYTLLAEPTFFEAAFQANKFEVYGYWSTLEQKTELSYQLVEAYQPILENPHDYDQGVLWSLAFALHATGCFKECLNIWKHIEDRARETEDDELLQSMLGNQALILQTLGEWETAEELLHQQEAICRRLKNWIGLALCLGNQALILQSRGELEQAMELLEFQESLCRRLKDSEGLSRCLSNQGEIQRVQGKWEQAKAFYKEAESIYRRLNDPSGLQSVLGNQALVHQAQGEFEQAELLHKQQEEICRQLNDPLGLYRSLCNQGEILRIKGQLEEAGIVFREVESICRKIDNPAGLAASLSNQALILMTQGELPKAMIYLQQAESLCRKLDDPAGVQRSLGNQAVILQLQGEWEQAMQLHQEEEAICRKLNDQGGVAKSLCGQALIWKAQGEWEQAIELHKEEESICREFNDPTGLARSLCNQGEILRLQGDFEQAMKLYQQVESLSRALGDPVGLSASLGNQALIFQQQGNFEHAMEVQQQKEAICRQLNDPNGLAISLYNQGQLLAYSLNQPEEGLPFIEEAWHCAQTHGLVVLVQQIEPTLQDVRQKLKLKE